MGAREGIVREKSRALTVDRSSVSRGPAAVSSYVSHISKQPQETFLPQSDKRMRLYTSFYDGILTECTHVRKYHSEPHKYDSYVST